MSYQLALPDPDEELAYLEQLYAERDSELTYQGLVRAGWFQAPFTTQDQEDLPF